MIDVLLSEGHPSHLAALEAIHPIDGGFRAWKHVASVSRIPGDHEGTDTL
jgi:hypothetical protein